MTDFSKIVLVGRRILVSAPSKSEDVTKSGIMLPTDHEAERKVEGEIVMIGEDIKLLVTQSNLPESEQLYKIGRRVLFTRYAKEEVELDGKKYWLLSVGTQDRQQPQVIFVWP